MTSVQLKKRYPGVKPFETSERDLFFGRERDIEDLFDLILLERLVVLFGKSGYGKSSLINAGILPEIGKVAVPVVVRLGSYVPGLMPSPLDNLRSKIGEVLEDNPNAGFIEKLNTPTTLWHLVKRKQTMPSPNREKGEGAHKGRRFVFVFDQFEEFFTYPPAEQQAFKEQLAELLYTEVPQTVRNLNDTLTEAQQAFIATSFDAKALFAIRADRMSLLDSMKDKLPAILQKRYELKGLTEAQAREAIERPAMHLEVQGQSGVQPQFASPSFTYSPDALNVMTHKLAQSKGLQNTGIEAFQLQILCEYLEDKIIKAEIPHNRIESEHFANKINEIFEGYYLRLIEKLEPSVQHAAQLLIEEKLIFEDEKTAEARRLSVDSGVLLHEVGVTQSLLYQLQSTFLLRRESTSTGGFAYELCHDTLIAPILKSKSARKAREKEAQDILEVKRKQRRWFVISILVILAFVVVVGVAIYVIGLLEVSQKSNRASFNTALILQWNKFDRNAAAAIAHYNLTNHSGNLGVEEVSYQILSDTTLSNVENKVALHEKPINSIAFSPNGLNLATASDDNTARIWSIETGKELKALIGHNGGVTCLAYSPDGNYIVTGSDDCTAKLWSANTGLLLKTYSGHRFGVNTIAFSPNGKFIATGSNDHRVILWSVESEVPVQTLLGHKAAVYSVAFSPISLDDPIGGKYIATGGDDEIAIIWLAQSGQTVKTISQHKADVYSVAFSPDGTLLATASADHSAKLWLVPSGQLLRTFEGHRYCVNSVAFSPDGKSLATGSDDNTAKVWDLETTQVEKTLIGHQGEVNSVVFSLDGKYLATGSGDLFGNDHTAKLWAIETALPLKTCKGHIGELNSVEFSPNGRYIVTTSRDSTAKLWSAEDAQLLQTYNGFGDPYIKADFLQDSKHLALQCNVSGYDAYDEVSIWSITPPQRMRTIFIPFNKEISTDFSPDLNCLFVRENNFVYLFSFITGESLKTSQGRDSMQHSPLNQIPLVNGFYEDEITWDETFGLIRRIKAGSPDGKYFAVSHTDNTIQLLSAETGQHLKTFSGHQKKVTCISFSPDGKYIASGSEDKMVKLWPIPPTFNPLVIQNYSLLDLYYLGVQLEASDLKIIGKKRNLYQ